MGQIVVTKEFTKKLGQTRKNESHLQQWEKWVAPEIMGKMTIT